MNIQIDELNLEINKLIPKIRSLEEALKIADSKSRLNLLEKKSAEPDFWNNSETSQKVL